MQDKQKIREKYRIFRNKLSEKTIDDKSIEIANELLKLPIWDYTYYHIFLPISTLKEINTPFILHILSGKDKEIVLSKTNFVLREMTSFLLTENTKITINSYGIPEPNNGIEVPENKIDVVFVPLFAYDKIGNRVGYGKGFYDRFLKKCKVDVYKIGLSFFDPEPFLIERNETDVLLDCCVTPKKTYFFKRD